MKLYWMEKAIEGKMLILAYDLYGSFFDNQGPVCII